MQRCVKCSETLPLEAFSLTKRSRTGRAYQCKDCERRYRASPAGFAAALRREYGLDVESYARALNQQDGRCAVCRQLFWARGMKAPRIDHCHATGAFRGLLCHSCNVSAGLLRDSPEIATALAIYLSKEHV